MPNWCYTQIIFHGSKNEIEDFHNKIHDWTSREYVKTDFDVNWLGNILHGAGLGDRIDAKTNCIRCRGSISYIENVEVFSDVDATFYVNTETAWAPMIKMWLETIKILDYKTIGFSYLAEEPGAELYQIYDPYGDFESVKYYVDCFIDGEDLNDDKLNRALSCFGYFESDDALEQYLMSFLEPGGTLDDLINSAKNYPFKDESSYICIHEFERLDSLDIYA